MRSSADISTNSFPVVTWRVTRLRTEGGCLFRETKVRRIRTHSPDWVIVAGGEFVRLADILPCLFQTRNVGIARERKQKVSQDMPTHTHPQQPMAMLRRSAKMFF
jgi:hypothetical protein